MNHQAQTTIDPAVTHSAGSYLTFTLDGEVYGIGILSVREIIGMMPVTRLPGAASDVLGVINLRGRVLPVVSLRSRFGMPQGEAHPHNVTIIIEDGSTRLGIAVDRVNEVVKFGPENLEPPPAVGLTVNAGFVKAIGKNNGKVTILLDAAHVVTAMNPNP